MKASAKQNKNETKNKVIALNMFQKIQIQKQINNALVTNWAKMQNAHTENIERNQLD